jgi:hypothetical protein
MLRRLAEESFVPPPNWQEAFDFACRSKPPAIGSMHAVWEEETNVRQKLDAFAANFFSEDPAARRARFEALEVACRPFPNLTARLRRLRPGLDVKRELPAGRSERVTALATRARELFVMRPTERAMRRQEIMHELGQRAGDWGPAAREIRQRHPEIAVLEPDLVGRMTAWSSPPSPPQQNVRTTSSGGSRGATAAGWLVVVLVINLVRLGFNSAHSTATQQPTYRPTYSSPAYTVPQVPVPNYGSRPGQNGVQPFPQNQLGFQQRDPMEEVNRLLEQTGQPPVMQDPLRQWREAQQPPGIATPGVRYPGRSPNPWQPGWQRNSRTRGAPEQWNGGSPTRAPVSSPGDGSP